MMCASFQSWMNTVWINGFVVTCIVQELFDAFSAGALNNPDPEEEGDAIISDDSTSRMLERYDSILDDSPVVDGQFDDA